MRERVIKHFKQDGSDWAVVAEYGENLRQWGAHRPWRGARLVRRLVCLMWGHDLSTSADPWNWGCRRCKFRYSEFTRRVA